QHQPTPRNIAIFVGHFNRVLCSLMGPIRGNKKKRKFDIENGLDSGSPEEGSNDWWKDFSKRIVDLLISLQHPYPIPYLTKGDLNIELFSNCVLGFLIHQS
ncbi:hypothetical protein R6Q59_021208, partial [Mikania micrantha]